MVRRWHAPEQELPIIMNLARIVLSSWDCTTQEPLAEQKFWMALVTARFEMVQRIILLKRLKMSAHTITFDPGITCSSNSICIGLVLTTCNWPGSASILAANITNGLDNTGGHQGLSGWILIVGVAVFDKICLIDDNSLMLDPILILWVINVWSVKWLLILHDYD